MSGHGSWEIESTGPMTTQRGVDTTVRELLLSLKKVAADRWSYKKERGREEGSEATRAKCARRFDKREEVSVAPRME